MKRIKKHNKLIRTAVKCTINGLIPWVVISYVLALSALVISLI